MTEPHARGGSTILAGTGVGARETDLVIDLGPSHPSSHGALRLALTIDGGVVESAEPVVGFMHRGAEKLFEVRDYRQILMLTSRHDWLAGPSSEVGVAIAVEAMSGITVPERATWIRMLLCEITRAAHHCAYAAYFNPAFADLRESLLAELDAIAGGRIHPMYTRIGGVVQDLPGGWTGQAPERLRAMGQRAQELAATTDAHLNLGGLACLTREDAIGFGTSGVVARASGLTVDLRRDDPFLAYGELDVPVASRTAGDAKARVDVLLEEITTALGLARGIAERLDTMAGPTSVKLPKVFRAPEGSTYRWAEGPSGINGYYVVSRNEKTPWRLKIRSAAFNNVQSLGAALPGTPVDALAPALASFFFVVGDVDR